VINEQDRLIHDALMSKLPTCTDKWEEDFEFVHRLDNNMGLFSPMYGMFSPKHGAHGRRPSCGTTGRLSLDGEALLKDFLPPASPATISLLEKSGWTTIPKTIKEEIDNE
jgi:hypothetical protein